MKYLFSLMLCIAALNIYAQSPYTNQSVSSSNVELQLKKKYHSSTIVELSGAAIAFVGVTVINDPAGKGAFVMFGSSIVLGGLIYSLINTNHNNLPAQQYYNRRTEIAAGRDGVGVKMKF